MRAPAISRLFRAIGVAAVASIVGGVFAAVTAAPAAADDATCDVTLHTSVSAEGFTHPGVGLTAATLENARAQVASGAQPWTDYYQQMAASPEAAVTVTSSNASAADPTKPASVAFNSQSFESRFIADGLKAYTQTLMYVLTGKVVYRANAMAIIRIWEQMDPAQYAFYTDAHIHTGIPLNRMVTAAEILRYSGCAADTTPWTADDTTRFTTNLITPVIETFQHDQNHFMNQHLYPLLGAMGGYIFTDDRARYDEAVEWFTVNSTAQDQGFNGSISRLFRMVTQNDKTGQPVPDPHVQQVEMGRDQAHGGGDLTNAYYLARMIMAQGTKVDPVQGTVSSAPNAVGPYEFLGDRILAAADYFWQFMLGHDPEWTPVGYAISPDGTIRDTYDHISNAYRGRYNTASFWDLYYYYTYTRGEDVSQIAPSYAEAFSKRLPLVFSYGGKSYNAWESPDGGGDFWLYVPAAAAGTSIPKHQASATVLDLEDRSTTLAGDVSSRMDGNVGYVRMIASATGAKIAYLNGSTGARTIVFRVRTDGSATMQLAPGIGRSVLLPDTDGQWRKIAVTLAANESITDLLDITVTGDGTAVDLDSMDIAPTSPVATPSYAIAGDRVVGAVGDATTADLSAAYTGSGTLQYSASGLPVGAQFDGATGVLSWTPTTVGVADAEVSVSDGTFVAAEHVRLESAQDRTGAIAAAERGYDPNVVYDVATLATYTAADQAAAAARASASDADFSAALQSLAQAADGLRLESPQLADGSLDYPALLASSTAGTTAYTLTDGTNQTGTVYTSAVGLAQVFDFGPFARVSATRFGLQSNIFEDRLAGSAVFGSNNGIDWTRLTLGTTTMTQDYQTLDVDPALQGQRFEFLKVQMVDPHPDVLYGTVNNLFEMTEFHIFGERQATVGDLDGVRIAAPLSLKNRVVPGNTVQLSFHAPQSISNVAVSIGGAAASVASDDGLSWTATLALPASAPVGRQLPFIIDYTTHDGRKADTVETTSDGSALYSSTDQGVVDASLKAAPVLGSDGLPSPSLATDAAKLFDKDATTYTDTRVVGTKAVLEWDLGEGASMSISGVDVLVRQDQYGTSRLSTLRFEGSPDGATWTPLTSSVQATSTWQHLSSVSESAFRYIRLVNGNIINLAETRVFGTYHAPVTNITSLTIGTSDTLGNYAVDGDTVTLDAVLSAPPQKMTGTVNGAAVTFVPAGSPTHLRATTILAVGDAVGKNVSFTVDHVTADGQQAVTYHSTTDGSAIRMGTDSGLITGLMGIATALKLDGTPDKSTTSRPQALFDRNLTTYTDARLVGSTADIILDLGAAHRVMLDRIELALRQDSLGTSRLSNLRLYGSDDLSTWTTLVTGAQPTLAWQSLGLTDPTLAGHGYRHLRLSNGNIMGVAELRLYGSVYSPVSSIAPVAVTTWRSEAPVLPDTVTATRADGSTSTLPVTWHLPDASTWQTAGTVTVSGDVQGTTIPATATVTVRDDGSTSVPAKGVLNSDNGWDTGLQDGDYNVVYNLWWGQNARRIALKENDVVIAQQELTMNSPQAQTVTFPVSGKANGTYVYTATLVDSMGTTVTEPLTVKVTDASPGTPQLSVSGAQGANTYTVTANLWWGTNASSYTFYDNGAVAASGTLTAATPSAQKAVLEVAGAADGTHTYTVTFTNAAGSTPSAPLDVIVKAGP